MVDTAQATRDVVAAYVGQLTQGCGNASCNEALCATGRRNVSGRPQRDYTTRSARTIAITLASGITPRARLCRHYSNRSNPVTVTEPASPRDPSAWSQILSDTAAVRNACKGAHLPHVERRGRNTSSVRLYGVNVENQLVSLRRLLDHVLDRSITNMDPAEETRNSKDKVPSLLYRCLEILTTIIPEAVIEREWEETNRYIGQGLACPLVAIKTSPETLENTIPLSDYLNYEPTFRFFRLMLEIIGARHELIAPFVREIERQREDRGLETVMAVMWLRKSFVDHWDGDPSVAAAESDGGIAITALMVLLSISKTIPRFTPFCFPIPAISARIDAMAMVQSFKAALHTRPSFHFLRIHSLFTSAEKAIYFRHFNHLRMREAHSDAHRIYDIISRTSHKTSLEAECDRRLVYLQEHYLVLSVSRANVLEDAFDQLWHRRKPELVRPLRVRLGEMEEYEVGQDLGGVQIEFFNLACKEMMKEDLDLFTTDLTTGYSYFRAGSLQPLHKYELCGLLFGLALYNGIAIPVSFPRAFYCELQDETVVCNTESIDDAWPTMSRSLESVRNGEVNGLEFAFPMEANGLRLSILPRTIDGLEEDNENHCLHVVDATRISIDPGNQLGPVDVESLSWPGWRLAKAKSQSIEVDETNQEQFVDDYISWLTVGSVFPQWQAFKNGFFSIVDVDSLKMLSPENVRDILEGSNGLDIQELRNATLYDEPYNDSTPYIDIFWQLVSSWPEEKQKQLVKFVTAAERVPAGGAGKLTFKIQGTMHEGVDELPSSSTCFGVLALPEYPDVATLDKKLSLALELGLEGFGTG